MQCIRANTRRTKTGHTPLLTPGSTGIILKKERPSSDKIAVVTCIYGMSKRPDRQNRRGKRRGDGERDTIASDVSSALSFVS